MRKQIKFRFKNKTVVIPATAVETWRNTPAEQVTKITDSTTAAAKRISDAIAAARVGPISQAVLWMLEHTPEATDNLIERWSKMADEKVKDHVLWLLQFEHFRKWNASQIKADFLQAVTMAAHDGDAGFFRKLGRRLERKPVAYSAPRPPSGLSSTLLDHWVSQTGLCLCWFSYPALASLLKAVGLFQEQDAVRKVVKERLRLVKLNPPLITRVGQQREQIICT